LKLIFEKSVEGSGNSFLKEGSSFKTGIPGRYIRNELKLPEVDEQTLVRHYNALSRLNYGVDTGFYPLGSCTMKYNPKINERVASNPNFLNVHPYMPEACVQGCMHIIYELEALLKEITGMEKVSLIPGAGAHGEFVGIRMIKAYHEKKKNNKNKVIIPDTAHGTNPASCALAGYKVLNAKTEGKGVLTPEVLEKVLDDEVAALMMTNPNTLGLFETHINEIAEMLHKKDALLYCDGANFNAILGTSRFGDMGVDVIHLNLHKTFSTPHGGGGPGSGPVAASKILSQFLPGVNVEREGAHYRVKKPSPDSIGLIKSFYGNFGIFVRAYSYIRSLGPDGLRKVSETALLNANYIRVSLEHYYDIPFPQSCMHEVVLSDKKQKKYGITTVDIAKRLIDKGFHPPTIYFPLVVPGAMMIEPVETESKQNIDRFINAMIEISVEAKENPDMLKEAPLTAPIRRLDEVFAARKPVLTFREE